MKWLYFYFFILLSASLQANAAIQVSSGLTQEYAVVPGQLVQGVLTLKNGGRDSREVKLSVDDRYVNGQNRAHNRSSRGWLRLSQNKILLAANSTSRVKYTMRVPANLNDGTYWSMLNVDPLSKQRQLPAVEKRANGGFVVKVRSKIRYRVNVMAHVGSAEASYKFSAPRLGKDAKNKKILFVDIQNIGKRHGRPTLRLDVFNQTGASIATLKAVSRGLYPQAKKTYSINISGLRVGNYKTLLTAEDQNNGRTVGSDLNLSILP